jgi:hypothetical protein
MRAGKGATIVAATAIAIAIVSSGFPCAAARIEVASGERPAILDQVDDESELLAAAIDPEGERAAFAFATPDGTRARVVFFPSTRTELPSVELPGTVRDILFAPDGSGVWFIHFKPARKRLGDARLMWLGLEDPRAKSLLRLAPTAAAIDLWTAGEALLVAARDEVSTIRLEGYRSGRLFRLVGENLSLTALASSDLLLVGQTDALVLMDLGDRPGETEMPRRAELSVDSPVVELASTPDGRAALARLRDDRLLRVTPWPLAAEPDGTALAVLSIGKGLDTRPVSLPAPASDEVAAVEAPVPSESTGGVAQTEMVADDAPSARHEPPQTESGSAESAAEPHAVDEGDASTEVAGLAPAVTPSDGPPTPPGGPPDAPPNKPAATAESEVPPTPNEATTIDVTPMPSEAIATEAPDVVPVPAATTATGEPSPGRGAQLWGRIEGPAATQVHEVVLLGPDNILVEARRVQPDEDGIWRVDGMTPGRYQVQLSGDRNLVIIAEPRMVLVEVGADESTEAGSFRVLQAYAP